MARTRRIPKRHKCRNQKPVLLGSSRLTGGTRVLETFVREYGVLPLQLCVRSYASESWVKTDERKTLEAQFESGV